MTKKLLLRQVHPAHLTNGLSSAAFRPTPRDEGKLSVDCAGISNPQTSYELHIKKTRLTADGTRVQLESAGTWAFSRETCAEEKLSVCADPVTAEPSQPDNLAHHLVDFSSLLAQGQKKADLVAKRLRNEAQEIGRLWPLLVPSD